LQQVGIRPGCWFAVVPIRPENRWQVGRIEGTFHPRLYGLHICGEYALTKLFWQYAKTLLEQRVSMFAPSLASPSAQPLLAGY
jgi:hypothetical protein